jgi:hypothetical protein
VNKVGDFILGENPRRAENSCTENQNVILLSWGQRGQQKNIFNINIILIYQLKKKLIINFYKTLTPMTLMTPPEYEVKLLFINFYF